MANNNDNNDAGNMSFQITTDEEDLVQLNEHLTPQEQQTLLEFFESIQEELLGISSSGDVEINWDTREVHAFPEGSEIPARTWSLDEILNTGLTVH